LAALLPGAAFAAPSLTVTVTTTSMVADGDTSGVAALLADPGDDGQISFPEALAAVNNSGVGHTIAFDLATGATISHSYTFGLYASSTTIDGDSNGDGAPDVVFNGPNGFHSIIVYSDNNTLRNLVITGIGLDGVGAHHNRIVHNYIGVDVTGTVARSENTNGIEIEYGAHGNIVGGTTQAERNIIAGHDPDGVGVMIHAGAENNQIIGNWIGLNVNGQPLPNYSGVSVSDGATGNVIGGVRSSTACDGPCNLISGNARSGVALFDAGTSNNRVEGNFIGLNLAGTAALPNGSSGVSLIDGPQDNIIGGMRSGQACTGPCNVISGNSSTGVYITGAGTDRNAVDGNFLGVTLNGSSALGNAYHGVEISGGAAENRVGGARNQVGFVCNGACNVISGHGQVGVVVAESDSDQNSVRGNFIGVNAAGTAALANGLYGVAVIATYGESPALPDSQIGPSGAAQQPSRAPDAMELRSLRVQPLGARLAGAGNASAPDRTPQPGAPAAQPATLAAAGPDQTAIGSATASEANLIAGNVYGGVLVDGAGTQNTHVLGNRIGYSPSLTPLPNDYGGVIASTGATTSTIGGLQDGEGNEIYGGVFVNGAATRAAVHGNTIDIPGPWSAAGYMPIDIETDGATCYPWQGGSGANSGIPAPRLLAISSAGVVQGATRPGASVEVYRVVQVGAQYGRYFPRRVEPVGHGQADVDGRFSISTGQAPGVQLVATATLDGSTSELSQIQRPVIFVHGIGGSWLRSAADEWLWLPPAGSSNTVNDRLARLSLDAGGASLEPVTVAGVIELGGFAVYGPVLEWLDDHGYNRTPDNLLENDIYAFAYDWRLGLAPRADELMTWVDALADPLNGAAASSCEVDIVAHSMGGMVSSLYVRSNPEHSQDHVHRLITIGTPYLGTPQAAKAHTMGYVFDLDKKYFWVSFDWGRMLQMARNLTAGYTLMPSPNYFTAGGIWGYLRDLRAQPVDGYANTFAFLTTPKVDGAGNPLGLARNGGLWASEQAAVHDQIDDWSGWSGPPQIFRIVGNTGARTAVEWRLGPLSSNWLGQTDLRREPGDTNTHVFWRSGQFAVLGPGDETVALPSATLGRGVGADFSGVDNWWIRPHDTFAEDHLGLVTEDASLTRMTDILAASFTVPANANLASTATPETASEDLFYIFGSAPIAVHVWDDLGNHTGPVTPTHFSEIEYNVPGVSYWHNDLAISLSLQRGTPYTLTVEAPVAATRLRIVRVIPDSAGLTEQALFPDQTVALNGSLRVLLDSAGAPSTAPLEVDGDGDGDYEGLLLPAEQLASTQTGPDVPEPYPWSIAATAVVTDTANQQVEVIVPAADAIWQWQASADVPWITPGTSSGQTPAVVTATLASTTLPAGVYTGTLTIALSYGSYEVDYPVTIRLTVSGGNLAVTLASFSAEAQASGIVVNWETTSEIGNAGFNLYRSTSDNGPRGQLNPALIPSQSPGSTQGASYSYVDAPVDPGQTYWYWLEDIALSGAATLHGPVSATASVPTAVRLAGINAGQSPAPQTTGAPLAALPAVVALALGAGWTALSRRR
jgi:hypothetical protein